MDKYCVQSAEIFHPGEDVERWAQSKLEFIELFIEEAPDQRGGRFDSLDEAISDHEKEFLGPTSR